MRLTADDTTLRQMVSEYREMPGLCLTARQAGRLWQLAPEEATRLLDLLVDLRFLVRTDREIYVRRSLNERPSEPDLAARAPAMPPTMTPAPTDLRSR